MQNPTTDALHRVLALLKPRQLRALALDLLTQPQPVLCSTAEQPTPIAPAQSAERYTYLTADGHTVDADSEAVAVIQDNQTGLQWSAKPLLDGKAVKHAEAVKAGAECRLLGGTDWQLMSLEQAHTAQDFTRHQPALQSPFVGRWPKEGWAWTRTDCAAPVFSGYAWGVDLGHGNSDVGNRNVRGVALACRPVPVVASPRQ